jgi:predicted ester cyclase
MLTMSLVQDNINLYNRFLAAMNASNYEELDTVIDKSFVDHHSGFEVNSLADYKKALEVAHSALAIQAILEDIIAVDDKVITRARLTGKHIGTFLNMLPTNKELNWTTIEIWRIENGKFIERWAEDDLLGLVRELGVSLPF